MGWARSIPPGTPTNPLRQPHPPAAISQPNALDIEQLEGFEDGDQMLIDNFVATLGKDTGCAYLRAHAP